MARSRKTADPLSQLTVVFDYGGVLSEGYDPLPTIHRAVGGDREAVARAYWDTRKEFDAGHLSVYEYWAGICEAAGITDLSEEEAEDLQDLDNRYWGTIAGGSRELIHDLARNGVRLVLLSNTSASFGAYVREREWFEAFSFAVISAEEGVLKPEREIFDIVLETVAHETGGVSRPSTLIFFDDIDANVEAAKVLGIDAHLWPRNTGAGDSQMASAEKNDEGATNVRPGWEVARSILAARGIPLD